MEDPDALLTTDLPFPVRRGKVRDVYDLGDTLLIIATDRISAFDVIMPTAIPGKGAILTALSLWWFNYFADVPNHLLATDPADFPSPLRPFAHLLRGRSMLCRKARVVPIECVARGYLAGSAWKEYRAAGTACSIPQPPGLQLASRFPTPLFTPATKADTGHDENIPFARAAELVGTDLMADLRTRTLDIYTRAAAHAATAGLILADTKLEWGIDSTGKTILIDELLTPDSSRFWPADAYRPGEEPPSFDKQFLRDWLERQPWNKSPPAPALPPDIVAGTLARYQEAHRRITSTG